MAPLSANSETSWQSWILGSLWNDVDESSASVTKENTDRSLMTEPRKLKFTTSVAADLLSGGDDDDGGSSGKKSGDDDDDNDNGGDDDGGGIDDCERPAYRSNTILVLLEVSLNASVRPTRLVSVHKLKIFWPQATPYSKEK
jgi:hypothetical protein